MSDITIERTGRIANVRFDQGDRANALSLDIMRRLTACAEELAELEDLSAVVLSGGAENFCLGFDLKDPEVAALADAGLATRRRAFQTGRKMCRAWAELEPITIAAIDGWCVGGGLALAVALDLRVASPSARFYAPEIERGMNMSWGSVPRVVNLVGPARAKRLLALAERVAANDARGWGLVDDVAANPLDAAAARAAQAAAMPPTALRMIKQAVDAYAGALAETASWADYDQFALSRTTADHEEGVAAFLEGRAPRFSGG